MKLEVASKPLEDDEIVAALAAVVPDSELDVKVFECIFSRKLENRNWVFPTMSSYSYGRTSACGAQVPARNSMNEWLGEPVLVLQLPGRGILRYCSNKPTN